ncbi:unnamed protein product [Trichobilharzia regenti]|nr:unnamed protein product [Trichobilharzia regenti]
MKMPRYIKCGGVGLRGLSTNTKDNRKKFEVRVREDQPGSELSSYPTSSSTTKGGEKEKNNSFNPQQPVTSESVDKQSELEAKLQEVGCLMKFSAFIPSLLVMIHS